MRLLELDDALLTPVGREAGPLRHGPELFRAGADHQTDDLIGALLIEPVASKNTGLNPRIRSL